MDRIKKLQKRIDIPFVVESLVDIFYLTGLSLSRGRLWVSSNEAILFVDGRYFEIAKERAPCEVALWEEQKKIAAPKMGFDASSASYDVFLEMKKIWPHTELVPEKSPVALLRAIKEKKEVEALQKGADLTRRGIEHIAQLLKVGVSEEELALEFEFFCRKGGASGMSFSPIIAFGENSAYPHYRAGKTKLKDNQLVLIDVGAIVDGYYADLTRVVHFGKVAEELLRMEEIVRRAQKIAMDYVKPGIKAGELDQLVHDEFDRENVKQLYIHSLGHGVGLQGHEFPQIRWKGRDHDVVLEPGMVFTIEPGLYRPKLGGVRWEDMVLVTEKGYVTL
jgi:Xaa-Pro aminopeptidase